MIGKTVAKVFINEECEDCIIQFTDGTVYSLHYYHGISKKDNEVLDYYGCEEVSADKIEQ